MRIILTKPWIHNHPPFENFCHCLIHCPVVAFAGGRYGFGYWGKTEPGGLFVISIKGFGWSTVSKNKIPIQFSHRHMIAVFKREWKSHLPDPILSTSVCSFCPFIQVSWSADLACLSWPVLPCTVISLCFLLLLQFSHLSYPDLTRRTSQNALTWGWKISSLPSVTHMFSTFCQCQGMNYTFPDVKLNR